MVNIFEHGDRVKILTGTADFTLAIGDTYGDDVRGRKGVSDPTDGRSP